MSEQPKPNAQNANMWNMNENQPYARRSVSSIFNIILIFAICALALYWYMGQASDEPSPVTVGSADEATQSSPGLKDMTKSAIKMVKGDTTGTSAGEAAQILENQAEAIAALKTQYENSVNDIINSDVMIPNGESAGKIHDILIHKDTGQAKAIIINSADNGYYSNELKKLSFSKVTNPESEGTLKTSVTAETLADQEPFDYAAKNEKYISLRSLENGKILDDQGQVAGKIIAIIYQDADTQSLYFALSPALAPNKKDKRFGIAFEAANLVKSDNGYDIKLTKAQTEALARQVF